MPKTKRDILKRRCDQMQKHVNTIRWHIGNIYAPYSKRKETKPYEIIIIINETIQTLENKIYLLRKEL